MFHSFTAAFRKAFVKTAAISATLIFAGSAAQAVTITQNTTFTPTTATGWTNVTVGSISLADGTNFVSDMTGNASVQDQGWGGHDFFGNDLRVGLFDGATQLWSVRMAGAGRVGLNPINQVFDISTIAGALDGLNAALQTITWTPSSDVRLDAFTAGNGWPGWSITVNSGNLSVTSGVAPVPVPAAAGLLLAGIGLLGAAGLRKRKTA